MKNENCVYLPNILGYPFLLKNTRVRLFSLYMFILISVFRRIEFCVRDVSVKILVLYHIAVIFYWKIDVLLGIITKSGRFIIFSVTLKKLS